MAAASKQWLLTASGRTAARSDNPLIGPKMSTCQATSLLSAPSLLLLPQQLLSYRDPRVRPPQVVDLRPHRYQALDLIRCLRLRHLGLLRPRLHRRRCLKSHAGVPGRS